MKSKGCPVKTGVIMRNYFNEKIVKDYIRYALVYVDGDGAQQTVFIHEKGAMSSAPFGYNGLPRELVEDKEKLQIHFEEEFNKRNISFGLVDFRERNSLLGIGG